MKQGLLDILRDSSDTSRERIDGVVVGIVTNNQDSEGMARVRVRFPWLSDEDESWWARIAVPMAGNDRGTYFLPEVDDEVLVAFEHGDIRSPFVVGALWNGKDKPPVTDDPKNDHRVIKSRSGHVIRLDDKDGKEKIEVMDKTKKNKIVIDTENNAISILADGNITLESTNGNVIVKGQNIEMQSTAQHVKIEAKANMDLKAGPQLNIKGGMVNIN